MQARFQSLNQEETDMPIRISLARLVLIAVVFSALPSAACGKTVGETIDDATITTRVKTSLLNDPAVAGLSIDVDTFKGVVTLSGRVSPTSRRNAQSSWRATSAA